MEGGGESEGMEGFSCVVLDWMIIYSFIPVRSFPPPLKKSPRGMLVCCFRDGEEGRVAMDHV